MHIITTESFKWCKSSIDELAPNLNRITYKLLLSICSKLVIRLTIESFLNLLPAKIPCQTSIYEYTLVWDEEVLERQWKWSQIRNEFKNSRNIRHKPKNCYRNSKKKWHVKYKRKSVRNENYSCGSNVNVLHIKKGFRILNEAKSYPF